MRSRHAATVLIATCLALPAAWGQAAPQGQAPAARAASGELFGLVTDAAGRREANAVVEVRGQGLHSPTLHCLTSVDGIFLLRQLKPGAYYVEVGKDGRLAERRRVEVHASERALLLVNLPQLLQAAQFGPPAGIDANQAFAWALRQATIWRPILRLQDTSAAASAPDPLAGYVALTAGSGAGAFVSPSLATAFGLDAAGWGGTRLALSGELGTNGAGMGESDTALAANLRSANAANPERLMLGLQQVAVPGLPAMPSLRVLSLNYASALQLGDAVRVQYGAMMDAVTMTDTVATLDPYLRASWQLGAQAQLEYRVASAVPPLHFDQDFATVADPIPQVTLQQSRARLEQARHQELAYSDNLTPNDSLSVAVFDDQFRGAAINGAYSLAGPPSSGADPSLGGNLLPDLLNNMFIANGGNYGGPGYRLVYGRRLGEAWQLDLGFADGGVLAPTGAAWAGSLATGLAPARDHAFTAKLSGVTPLTHTRLVCSYRALGRAAATGLDLYDDGAAQSDSYANLSLRQPLPSLFGGSEHLAALIEIHNLLAQGYIPMVGSDGHTLYLVQSARSLRGGLTISF